MKVIGITGGVGAGKSDILSFLETEYKARVIQADLVGHQVMEPGTEIYRAIVETFGADILQEDGRIDRKVLGAIVFANPDKLQTLNALVHPAVKTWIREEIDRERAKGRVKLLVVEAALLIEDHYETICEEFWYIYTNPQVRRERLKATRGYTDEKITAIFASQQPDEVFREHCQVVIDNSGTKEETREQVRKVMAKKGWDLEKET